MAARLRVNDEVVVVSGSYRKQRGRILKISVLAQRAFVQGINLVVKYSKKSISGETSVLTHEEASLPLSVLMLVHSDGVPGRVGFQVHTDGSKTRIRRSKHEKKSNLDHET